MPPQPDSGARDPAELFITYLDFYRAEVVRKVGGLDDAALDSSRVPSGWTPRQLIDHLVHMERRWFVWGFLGEYVADPWGDQDADGVWHSTCILDELVDRLTEGGRRTTEILRNHPLTAASATTGRFAGDDDVPTLLAVSFHVLQEYARHAGHLDIGRELIDGMAGEG